MNDTEVRYILMNKNKRLAGLEVGLNRAVISEIYGDIPHFIGNFYSWVENRTTLFGRDNLVKMAKLAGISNEHEFLTISRALSINDTLWVNDLKYPTTWDKINPYKVRLSRVMAEIALNGLERYNNENLKSPSPQYRIDGSVDKCVKRTDGALFLYKTDGEKWSDLAGSRPYSEYYCTAICKQLNIRNFTEYFIKVEKTNNGYYKPYTYCKLFTNESNGLIQMADSIYREKSTEELLHMLNGKRNDMVQDIREMLIIDSLTLNIDRHMGNYGFIMNNDTFKINGMAPFYDNDCALGSTISIQDKSFDEAYNEIMYRHMPKTDLGDYNDMAKFAMTKTMYNRLKNINYISLGKKVQGLSDKRFQFMEYIVNRRRKEILNLFN